MTQPAPKLPLPDDDFLISDDTDLDAASQWLLGLAEEAAHTEENAIAQDNPEEEESVESLLAHHPDILPDPPAQSSFLQSSSLKPSSLQSPAATTSTGHHYQSPYLAKSPLPNTQPYNAQPYQETKPSRPAFPKPSTEDIIAKHRQPLNLSAPSQTQPKASPISNSPRYIEAPSEPRQQTGYMPPTNAEQDLPLWVEPDEAVTPDNLPSYSNTQPQTSSKEFSAPKPNLPINNPRHFIEIQNPHSLWVEVLERLKSQMTKPSFETWIAPLHLIEVKEDRVTLTVDSEFNRDWVLKKYRALLTEAFSSRLERMVMIQIDVREVNDANENISSYLATAAESSDAFPKNKQGKKQSVWTPRTAQSNLNPKYTFDTFIVGTGNRFCHAAALAVAETPAQSYNPFFIYGGVGLGKTHIMQAIAHFAHQHHPEMAVRYVTAEQFTNELINAITGKTMKAFRDRYRKNDILIIDDIQFLEGKERTQEEIFHTFNALHQSGKQIILSSDRAPKYLSQLEDRLRSRFEWGLITDIQPADFETRLAILQSKVKRDHFHVPDEVLVFIAESYPNNIRELEGALNKVTAYAMLTKTILDLATAKHLLGANQPENTQISKEKIIEVVAEYYHLTAADLKSPSRSKDVSHARQVSIYVVRHLTEASFPKIGDLLGGRKHTTILYAYEKMKEELERHPNLAQQVQEITGRVKSP